MEENSEGLSVGSENDNLGDTTVQGLGGLVGTLLQLAGIYRCCQFLSPNCRLRFILLRVERRTLRRLDKVKKFLFELGIGKGPG